MKPKFGFNMSSNLKRSKFYFLAIAFLSFAIILISYNWNVRENIYKISRDISRFEIASIHIPDIKINDRSREVVVPEVEYDVTTEDVPWSTDVEKNIENKIINDQTDFKGFFPTQGAKQILPTDGDRNEVTKTVDKIVKMNTTVQANGDTKTDEADVDTKGVHIKHFSQNGDAYKNSVGDPQIRSNLSVKENGNTDVQKTGKLLDRENNDKVDSGYQSFGQKTMSKQNTTSNNNVINLDSLKISKKETQQILDKIHKLKSEILSDRKNPTDQTRSQSAKGRPKGHVIHSDAAERSHKAGRIVTVKHANTAERSHTAGRNMAVKHANTADWPHVGGSNVAVKNVNNRFKNFGLASNFINPMLWMSQDNQGLNNQYKNIDPDVTSRPDVCAECFANSFRRIINEPEICKGDTELLILITSTVARKDSRDAIRNTWCETCNRSVSKIKYVFVFGNKNDSFENAELLKESKQHHDIIQMDFYDTYANLTYKTISSFQWTMDFCQKAKYVMKTDDDMYVNTELLPLLLKAAPSDKFMGGMCWGPSSPHRDLNSKWYVSFTQYRHSLFPSMCSGTGYVMSRDTVAGVLRQSPNVPFFYLEDVYVAICVKRQGIYPVLLDGFKNILVDFEPCLYRNTIITSHEVNADNLYYMWKKSRTCPKSDLTPEMLYRAYPV